MGFLEEDFLPGDQERQSMYGKPKADQKVSYENRATYGHAWSHDLDWYEKVKPGQSIYVTAFRVSVDQKTAEARLVPDPLRLRLVKKKQARHSLIVSGQDDYWIEDTPHELFVFIHNRRGGQRGIRYAVVRRDIQGRFDLWTPKWPPDAGRG